MAAPAHPNLWRYDCAPIDSLHAECLTAQFQIRQAFAQARQRAAGWVPSPRPSTAPSTPAR
jgi:hypothetical protein